MQGTGRLARGISEPHADAQRTDLRGIDALIFDQDFDRGERVVAAAARNREGLRPQKIIIHRDMSGTRLAEIAHQHAGGLRLGRGGQGEGAEEREQCRYGGEQDRETSSMVRVIVATPRICSGIRDADRPVRRRQPMTARCAPA